MADREAIHPAACGYGLLGLCCDSCLAGPCRRSPFDDAAGGEGCSEDGDWICANNLMERVLLESMQTVAAFRDALERAAAPGSRVEASRRKEMKLLLSPFFRVPSALLGALYPEAAFPSLHALGNPGVPWMTALMEAATGRPPAKRDPEVIVADALRLSAVALSAEALAAELLGPAPREGGVTLPETPSPLLVIVADRKDHPDEVREALLTAIERACGGAARIYRMPGIAPLPAFARAVFTKWGIPVSMTRSIAVVASSSMTRGLGALALGFSLLAIPGYPIHGSARVENYLTEHLKNRFGHAYLAVPPREDPCEAILRSLVP